MHSILWVDIGMTGKSVRLFTKFTQMEADCEIECRQVLRPSGLLAGEHFGSGEILEVLVIGDDVDLGFRTF